MQGDRRIKALIVGITAGWISVLAAAAGRLPWRPSLAIHITLVGLLIAGTVIAAVITYAEHRLKGATHLAAMRLGETFATDRARITQPNLAEVR